MRGNLFPGVSHKRVLVIFQGAHHFPLFFFDPLTLSPYNTSQPAAYESVPPLSVLLFHPGSYPSGSFPLFALFFFSCCFVDAPFHWCKPLRTSSLVRFPHGVSSLSFPLSPFPLNPPNPRSLGIRARCLLPRGSSFPNTEL